MTSPIPSAVPPKIKGVSPAPTPDTPQSSVQDPPSQDTKVPDSGMTPQVVYPQTLSNGDLLLGLMEQLPLHSIRLIKRTDPTQKIPFLMDCKCGTQARVYSEDQLRESAARHLAIRAVREMPL